MQTTKKRRRKRRKDKEKAKSKLIASFAAVEEEMDIEGAGSELLIYCSSSDLSVYIMIRFFAYIRFDYKIMTLLAKYNRNKYVVSKGLLRQPWTVTERKTETIYPRTIGKRHIYRTRYGDYLHMEHIYGKSPHRIAVRPLH
jgi:hypothetical protein